MEKRDKNGLTETEFLAAYRPGDYERPSVAVDIMVFRMKKDLSGLQILLIRRGGHPYLGCLALPGGFIEKDESGYEAAQRELLEETGISDVYMEQSYTMTQPDRDPRMRIIDIAYIALLPYGTEPEPRAGDDAAFAGWYDVEFDGKTYMRIGKDGEEAAYRLNRKLFQNGKIAVANYTPVWTGGSALAFDHAEVLLEGLLQLQKNVEQTDIAFNLVPDEFSMPMIRKIYEILSCKPKDYTQTARWVKGKIEDTGRRHKSKDRPPAKLYRYTNK